MKKALILNISHNEFGPIRALHELGYYVIATGNNPSLAAKDMVDEYIQADYSNKDLILHIAEDKRIDAICSCCNDFGVITAAYVAEQMGLKGHDSYETALTLHHKDRFKRFAKQYGIQSPLSEGFEDIEAAKNWAAKSDLPLMVKPIDLTGGKGCSKASTLNEAMAAIDKAFAVSRIKHIVIEPYIEGTQHACCTFLVDRKVKALCTNNEYSLTNPYKVEVDTYPAFGFEPIREFMIAQIEKMASLLDLKDGIFHAQYILKDGKPYIIEVMRRILGNLYMLPAMKLTGLDWDYWETRAHCGLSMEDFPVSMEQNGYWSYRCVMGNKNGVVKGVHIPEEMKSRMFDKFELWKPGDVIDDYTSSQLGFYFFQFDSEAQMNEMMVERYHDIYVEYE